LTHYYLTTHAGGSHYTGTAISGICEFVRVSTL